MLHKVFFSDSYLDDMSSMDDQVLTKIYDNFIQPIKNGLTPPEELQGKYKPSSEMKFANSAMRSAFIEEARRRNLYHYHFGYRVYRSGSDPSYPGDVSDGILHTKISEMVTETHHTIFDCCLEHPSPFKVPFAKVASDDGNQTAA